jgi:hypothetical protein
LIRAGRRTDGRTDPAEEGPEAQPKTQTVSGRKGVLIQQVYGAAGGLPVAA